MKTKVGSRVASVILGLVLALGLAGCSGGGTSSTSGDEFVGVWNLSSLTGDEVPSTDDLALLEEMGMSISLTLMEGGDAYFDFLDEVSEGTWVAKSSEEVLLTLDGEKLTAKRDGDTLTIADDDVEMVFTKSDETPVAPTAPKRKSSRTKVSTKRSSKTQPTGRWRPAKRSTPKSAKPLGTTTPRSRSQELKRTGRGAQATQ